MLPQSHNDLSFGAADRLEPGDRIVSFALPDPDGRAVNPLSDRLAGRPVLLVFACEGPGGAEAFAEELTALRERRDALEANDVVVLAITRQGLAANGALTRKLALPFPVLSDQKAEVYGACGLDPDAVGRATVTLALDGNMRVAGFFDGAGATRWPEIAATLDDLGESDPQVALAGHPPVLVLPRVLSGEDCAKLVAVWHRPVRQWDGDGFTTQGFDESEGDFKVRNKDYGHVVQMVVRDPALQRYLDAKLQRRVMPEIYKTFQTKVSRREEYRIACYDAAAGGSLGPHRDNATKPTRHRRFTMAVTLNGGEFAGGGLQFREYSQRGYRVPTGTAIVWSCSLLHEVLPVTAGRRFILGTHLFGN